MKSAYKVLCFLQQNTLEKGKAKETGEIESFLMNSSKKWMKTQLNWSQYTMRCFMPISITTRKHYYWIISNLRRSSVRKGVLRNLAKFTGKHLCQSLFFNIFCFLIAASGLQFYFKALTHVFSCEFYKISKNTFFYRTPPVAASVVLFWLLLEKAIFSFLGFTT